VYQSTNLPGGSAYNFGWDINAIPASGNTNEEHRAYTLSFDMAVKGNGINALGGYVGPIIYVFGHNNTNGIWTSGEYNGNGAQIATNAGFFPAPASGWVHFEFNLGPWGTANAAALITTNLAFSFGVGAYQAGLTVVGEQEIDIANVELIMNTNLPPLPGPTMTAVPAKPGLRVFAQDNDYTYDQEGFGTVDLNQSWVGVATPTNPVSYSITIADFNTVDAYTLYVQFVQNGNPGDPFGVYNGQNALVWQITHRNTGFTTRVDWKTNAPASGQPNNALPLTTTTTTTGRGTWTLAFTNDTDGTVTAPDGTSGSFSLPNDPAWLADFANPCIIDFGTAPNNAAGYGQWITYSKIAISNVLDGTEYDDFTQDDVFNTALWNSRFSLGEGAQGKPPAVILVSTNSPLWVNWTIPDTGYGLTTKASLTSGTNVWFSPSYYGSNVGATNTIPTKMGSLLKWTLIPSPCLPTVDGTVGGPPSPTGFFRLSKPPPSQ
jgi:hypothetical protein